MQVCYIQQKYQVYYQVNAFDDYFKSTYTVALTLPAEDYCISPFTSFSWKNTI